MILIGASTLKCKLMMLLTIPCILLTVLIGCYHESRPMPPTLFWHPTLVLSWSNELTYFYKPELNGAQQVGGLRAYSAPQISFPFQKSWGFFTPSLTLSGTAYSLDNTDPANTTNFRQYQHPDKNHHTSTSNY